VLIVPFTRQYHSREGPSVMVGLALQFHIKQTHILTSYFSHESRMLSVRLIYIFAPHVAFTPLLKYFSVVIAAKLLLPLLPFPFLL
jgi:hypothetical protein